MIKKSVENKKYSKAASNSKTSAKKSEKQKKDKEIERILVSNFVSLQRVMVNLSVKFDELSNHISKLLELFETSAKVLAEKDFDIDKNNRENTKILEKLESVLEQNRTIARGLTLMHDKINESPNYYPPQPMSRMQPQQTQQIAQIPQFQQPPQFNKPAQKTPGMGGVSEEYHKPIFSNEQ
jgi:hypothetical protein